jgi:hypothetical protein
MHRQSQLCPEYFPRLAGHGYLGLALFGIGRRFLSIHYGVQLFLEQPSCFQRKAQQPDGAQIHRKPDFFLHPISICSKGIDRVVEHLLPLFRSLFSDTPLHIEIRGLPDVDFYTA